MKKTINTQTYHSLCGDLLLGSFEGKLCLCDWRAEEHRLLADRRLERSLNAEMKDIPSEITAMAAQELDEYFAGGRKTFDLPLLFVGTEFQEKSLEHPAGSPLRGDPELWLDGRDDW